MMVELFRVGSWAKFSKVLGGVSLECAGYSVCMLSRFLNLVCFVVESLSSFS